MIWILNYRARKNNKGYPIISTGRIASNGFFLSFLSSHSGFSQNSEFVKGFNIFCYLMSSVSPEDITRDASVIYAAVVRPNRTPVRSVDQSDRMYGNMLKLQKPNQGR